MHIIVNQIKNKKKPEKVKIISYIYIMREYKNTLMLDSKHRSYTTYREHYSSGGLYHILDDISFAVDTHFWVAKGICGTWFSTYYKHRAKPVDLKSITCKKCIKKADIQ